MPPSHILSTGQYVHLPPPTDDERAAFFERVEGSNERTFVDRRGRYSIGGDGGEDDGGSRKRRNEEDGENATAKKKKKDKSPPSSSDAPYVHPLAIASARIRAMGSDELSKAINLGGLVLGGEYFGLTNVIRRTAQVVDKKKIDGGGGGASAAARNGGSKGQYGEAGNDSASARDGDDDESTSLDARLRSTYVLRRRRDQYASASSALSRHSGGDVDDAMEVDVTDAAAERPDGGDSRPTDSAVCKTKAEPFAIADPTLGKVDVDFDPDKVPLLTLLFEIEKPSTGFAERATLSSSFSSSRHSASPNANDGEEREPPRPDERVVEALQHSLFCASLFESMRGEIIPASSRQRQRHHQHPKDQSSLSSSSLVAWLSSEMEESFLPPPSVMAGARDTSRGAASATTRGCSPSCTVTRGR